MILVALNVRSSNDNLYWLPPSGARHQASVNAESEGNIITMKDGTRFAFLRDATDGSRWKSMVCKLEGPAPKAVTEYCEKLGIPIPTNAEWELVMAIPSEKWASHLASMNASENDIEGAMAFLVGSAYAEDVPYRHHLHPNRT